MLTTFNIISYNLPFLDNFYNTFILRKNTIFFKTILMFFFLVILFDFGFENNLMLWQIIINQITYKLIKIVKTILIDLKSQMDC